MGKRLGLKAFTGIIFLLFVLSSCVFFQENEYRELNDDLSFKLHEIGESDKKIEYGDYLSVHFIYKTIHDSVFFEGRSKFLFNNTPSMASIAPALLLLSEGDSASLILGTENYFTKTLKSPVPEYLSNENKIKMDIAILEIQSQEEFNTEKKLFLKWMAEYNVSEKDKIDQYLESQNILSDATASGLHIISLKKGTGPYIKKGKRISIHYQGRFLNGHFIDDSYKRNEPLDFIYGTDFTVIDGINQALNNLREGDRVLVIIPSDLAFGKFGSAGGIVPPYTTLIYEIEVLNVY